MSSPLYYPILKWKTGEQLALKELNPKNPIIPVIQIVDVIDPADFFNVLKNCYSDPIYIDTLLCEDEDNEILKEYIDYANNNDIIAWPYLYISDINDDFSNILSITDRVAFNLQVPENFDGNSNKDIINHLITFDKKIDLFCDAGEVIHRKKANDVYRAYKELIKENEYSLKQFSNIVICLTSFPEHLNVESGGIAYYERYDYKMFEILYKKFKDIYSQLAYSDYGVTKFTSTDLDFSKIKVLPKVKYTTYENYIVHKGSKNRLQPGFTRSYIDISKEICNSDYFMGKDYSFGDYNIYDKANSDKYKPGNSTNWVTYCANHHLTVVTEQLSTLI